MNALTAEEKEILRHIVLAELAIRVGSAFTAKQIRNRAAMATPFQIAEDDVLQALRFHEHLAVPNVKAEPDVYGTSVFFYATSAGVLAAEREQAKQV